MADILLASKPIAPPWNDSGKNLVRDLAASMKRHVPIVLTTRGPARVADADLGRARIERIYPEHAGRFAPALVDNARVLLRLVAGRRADLWHFFFAPNPRASRAGRLATRLRRARSVHTVASAPREGAPIAALCFADRTVVLSRHTERRFLDAGVPRERLTRIAPAIEPLALPDPAARDATRMRLGIAKDDLFVVYPGDLEFGRAANVTLDAVASLPRARLGMACRAKTERAHAALEELRRRATEDVVWIGETAEIHAVLAAADIVALPADTLYAKMDYPLVLLEAMSLGRAVLVARGTPAEELAELGGAIAADAPEVDAVAASLARLADEAERARLGREARRVVLEHFHRDEMARAYESLYDEVLASG